MEIPYAPGFPVSVNFWEEDDEFASSGKTLVDESAEHYLEIEAVGDACSAVVQELRKQVEKQYDIGFEPFDEMLDSDYDDLEMMDADERRIRTKLTADGVINQKWKHELSLFQTIRKIYPDTLYQYRPEWLGRQSLDLYIPSLRVAIEYQGIQHYHPVEFFGGEEALEKRQELDKIKKQLCINNEVGLIEWPYDIVPSEKNVKKLIVNKTL